MEKLTFKLHVSSMCDYFFTHYILYPVCLNIFVVLVFREGTVNLSQLPKGPSLTSCRVYQLDKSCGWQRISVYKFDSFSCIGNKL